MQLITTLICFWATLLLLPTLDIGHWMPSIYDVGFFDPLAPTPCPCPCPHFHATSLTSLLNFICFSSTPLVRTSYIDATCSGLSQLRTVESIEIGRTTFFSVGKTARTLIHGVHRPNPPGVLGFFKVFTWGFIVRNKQTPDNW